MDMRLAYPIRVTYPVRPQRGMPRPAASFVTDGTPVNNGIPVHNGTPVTNGRGSGVILSHNGGRTAAPARTSNAIRCAPDLILAQRRGGWLRVIW